MELPKITLFLAAAALLFAQADTTLQKAIRKETLEGDLKGAIELYQKAIGQSGKDRATAAQALLRLGDCYEKKGDKQARQAYERLVKEFGDSKEASQARAKLAAQAALTTPAAAPTDVLLWKTERAIVLGLSPGESFIVYVRDHDLWRHDFAGGEDRAITTDGAALCSNLSDERGGASLCSAKFPKVSPDGRFVAYWWSAGFGLNELRVVGVDGSGLRVLAKDSRPGIEQLAPAAWSPDGAWLLVDRITDLALVSVADGSMTVLQSGYFGTTPNAFSPDGRYIVYDNSDDRFADLTKTNCGIWIMNASGSGAARILTDPAGVVSYSPMWAPDGRSVIFRSNRSGSTALWSVAMADGKAQGTPQLVSREDLDNLSLTRDGSLFHRDLVTQTDIYAASLDPKTLKVTTAPQQLNRRYVGRASGPVAWSPDGRSVAYMANGSLLVHSMDTDQDKEIKPAGAWSAESLLYSSDGSSLLVKSRIKPRVLRFSRVELQSANETALFDLQAVSDAALSPDGRTAYYSPRIAVVPTGKAGSGTVRIIRRDVQSGQETEVVRMDSKRSTVVLLSPDGRQIAFQYWGPDDRPWIMSVSSEGGAVGQLAQTDFIQASWTPDSRHLLINRPAPGRIDYSQGSVDYSIQLWSIPAEGGAPQPAGMDGNFGGVVVSLQNDRMAFVQTQRTIELKLYKNLLPPTQQ